MIIDPSLYGVSFSVKQCRQFQIDMGRTLRWLVNVAGFRRFRLMTYWDEHEPRRGQTNFALLDQQIAIIERAGGVITLCLGVRQPRWPENHWPEWAWQLPKAERDKALLNYIQLVVERCRDRTTIISYQLENEALLTNFGRRPATDRKRLRAEYQLISELDPSRPIIMTTSTSWGIPLRRPIPAIVGFSYYRTFWENRSHRYKKAGGHYMLLHRLRALLIRTLWHRPSFIHELQLEPWGPKNIWEMTIEEQNESMSPLRMQQGLRLARRTKLYPIDTWGGEWWYYRTVVMHDPSLWHVAKQEFTKS